MKYVYIVTRIIHGSRPGVVEIPNLGAHSSRASANRHFKSVLNNRKSLGGRVLWDRPGTEWDRQVARHASIDYPSKERIFDSLAPEREELRIERWPLGKVDVEICPSLKKKRKLKR